MSNPYISRGPLHNPEMFFGREAELNEIAAFLKGNQSVSIVGPRKIGKTTLLFHLLRAETQRALGLDDGYLFVYLDCEVLGEGGHEQIFGILSAEIEEALREAGLEPEPALDRSIEQPGRMPFERALRRLNQRGLRVILLMDEFERLSTNGQLDVNFFNALRSAAGRYQLAYLTASARPLIQLTYSDKSQDILSSPFFNIFAPLFLGLFDEATSRALIGGPSAQAGMPLEGQAQDFIYEYAGGHPLALQVTSFHALEELGKPAPVSLNESLDAVERRAMQELSAHFQYDWRNLNALEQTALRQINELAERAVSDTTLRAVLRDLVQKCLFVPTTEGTYRYPSRAWASFAAAQTLPGPGLSGHGLTQGARIGAYEVIELIGRGGMAEVYKGVHSRLERTVAIKVLSTNLASESDFQARFEREARSVASLRHPNIVQMFDFGDLDGMYYMVMEFIAGDDLSKWMAERGALPSATIQSLVRDVASALDYAHLQDLVHRDVKPSNVLLQFSEDTQRPRAVLTDFGIAKIRGGETGSTKTGMMMGTLNYMAPEQIRSSGEVDGRADLYSLGVLTYQLFTGHLPFEADNPGAMMLAHLQLPPIDPTHFHPDLPANTVHALLRALSKEPQLRFPTASQFVQELFT